MAGVRVGLFGATGQVGGVLLRLIAERDFPLSSLRLFASARSAGQSVSFKGESLSVEDAATADLAGLDLCFMCCGAPASLVLAPKLADLGAVVIDNSAAWRLDPDVPLVVAGTNDDALSAIKKGIVGNPNCTTMVAIPPLRELRDLAGLKRLVVSTYQAVSGAGGAGVRELEAGLRKAGESSADLALNGGAVGFEEPATFAGPIAFNVLPLAGRLLEDGSGETSEERKFRDEARKILGLKDLAISVTCVRVPVYTGHAVSINAELERPALAEEVVEAMRRGEGIELSELPTPLRATGKDVSLVGRIRRDDTVANGRGISLFVVGDNLRKGAALNALQIAEALSGRLGD